ncbi:hypothetical protein [Achromobacter spanius]|uniref:Uncharacterized protein n=1 Tax=Achromobacter spanius TaxID=217203 RepID=A0AA42LPX2_9BURK|nr:hypothetical protein [Achromobacter spanius]MDH0737325.1 hypothetical protein [Achromobacter spanius]
MNSNAPRRLALIARAADLGGLHQLASQDAQAELMRQRALAIAEEAQGSEHANTSSTCYASRNW